MFSTLVWIVGAISSFNCAEADLRLGLLGRLNGGDCKSDKIFFGSINETTPELVPYNGFYQELSGISMNGRKVYKHESQDLYLYFLATPSQWVASSVLGSYDILLATNSDDVISNDWLIWYEKENQWTDARFVRSVCADDDLVTCSSGQLLMTDLHRRHNIQKQVLGTYILQPITNELRPVYKHESSGDYLFYAFGRWNIGPEVNGYTGRLFSTDNAWRPEFILSYWVVYVGHGSFRDDQDVKLTCKANVNEENGASLSNRRNPHPHGEAPGRARLRIALGEPVCSETSCASGALCQPSSSLISSYYCLCRPGFFGPYCEQESSCGKLTPGGEGLEVASQTGSSYLDVILYRCVGNRRILGTAGSVCQKNGVWSAPPRCSSGAHRITPEENLRR